MNLKNIPKKVSLFGKSIDVKTKCMSKKLKDHYMDGEQCLEDECFNNILGIWDEYKQEIIINKKIPVNSHIAWAVLMHEIIHAISSTVILENEPSEKDVDRIASGITSFLIENNFISENRSDNE